MPKKIVKKSAGKKKVAKKPEAPKIIKPVGVVTHFYTAIKVAIVKFKQPIKTGVEIEFRGVTTDFKHKIVSMQFDHAPVSLAKKGQEVGIKVSKRVREGDEVFMIKQ
jgi:U32 family peptidase